jgi:hypothetical protein
MLQGDPREVERVQEGSGKLEEVPGDGTQRRQCGHVAARRPLLERGDGSEGHWSREEGDIAEALLDTIERAGTTRGRGARAVNSPARVHCVPKRWSPRGLGDAACPGPPDRVKSIDHTTDEVKESRDRHSGP